MKSCRQLVFLSASLFLAAMHCAAQDSVVDSPGSFTVHAVHPPGPGDLNRALAILAAFILVPIVVTLWMRRSALASAKADAPAAWFGFFRTMNWVLTADMLLWLTSSFGARPIFQQWIAARGTSGVLAALLNALMAWAPIFLTYFLCIALSYPLHEQLRGTQWTRREFIVTQSVALGSKLFAYMLAFATLEMVREQLELALVLLLLTIVFFQVLRILRVRVIKSMPQPLTAGEFRERILALAESLRVRVNRILLLPAGKSQVANAYAAKGGSVIFTDYLLQHLTKREVDAIAAHELAHLKHKHAAKRGYALIFALFLPAAFSWGRNVLSGILIPYGYVSSSFSSRAMQSLNSSLLAFDHWSQRDFVLVMFGLLGFYFLARHHENVADETAVRLTGDPEAQITGLLKVNRLNFVPIQWGKATESWLTHPSTVQRARRIAVAGGLPPARLEQILAQYHAETAQGTALPEVPVENRYAIPDPPDAEAMASVAHRRTILQAKLWIARLASVIPPALFSWFILRLDLAGLSAGLAYFAGLVITTALVLIINLWTTASAYGKEKTRLQSRFQREHLPVGSNEDIFVGIAPLPFPRLFGISYHWDAGFFIFSRDRLQFVGEKTRFALAPSDIDAIVIGPGGPNWYKFQRVYFRWKDSSTGRSGVFNVYPLDAGSLWHSRAGVQSLCDRLQAWKDDSSACPEVRPELSGLASPDIGGVQCQSPKLLASAKMQMKSLAYIFPLVVLVAFVFRAEIWYIGATALFLRVFLSIPYWLYRDRPPLIPHVAEALRAKGATVSQNP
jgi:Zn-dependent protease with chaperone function